MDRVPRGIDPRDFVREKFQEIKDARDDDDGGMTEHFERLVLRRERDPVLVDGETGHENRQVKIDAGERGETESYPEKAKLFHGAISTGLTRIIQDVLPSSATLRAMLDIRLIREKPDFVKERLTTRGGDDAAKIDELLRVDAERRKAETALQQLNADRKRLSKEIGGKRARGESSEDLENKVREIGDQIALLNQQTAAGDEQQRDLLA